MTRPNTMKPDDENRIYAQVQKEGAEPRDADYLAWLTEDAARQEKDTFVRSIWNDPAFTEALKTAESESLARTSSNRSWSQLTSPTWLAVAASIVVALTVTANLLAPPPEATAEGVYQTSLQEVQEQALADGSTANLSARTRVSVRFTPEQRHIQLLAGEARFSVRKDRSRPFVVETHQARMEALGTVFNVDQRGDVTELAVLEGQVAVMPVDDHAAARKVLAAGERVTISKQGLSDLTYFDPAQQKDWLTGWVTVEAMPLAELLIKLNRFSPVPLQAGDATTRNLLVSGSFELNKPDKNLTILATLHNLEVRRSASRVTLQKRL